MEIQGIKVGTIIEGPKWPEPVEIKKIDYGADYVHIVGATTLSKNHIDQLIPLEELSDIAIKTIDTDFKGEAWKNVILVRASDDNDKNKNEQAYFRFSMRTILFDRLSKKREEYIHITEERVKKFSGEIEQLTTDPSGVNNENLSGKWSVSGQYGSNTIYADTTLNKDNSYVMTQTAYIDNNGFRKFMSGSYQLDMESRLLYLASTEGVLTVYLINELQNDSFHVFNPNTRESYNFVRIPT